MLTCNKSISQLLVTDRFKTLPFWKCLDSNSPVKCKPISTEQCCNNTRDGHARCNCGPAGHVLSLTAATTKGFMAKCKPSPSSSSSPLQQIICVWLVMRIGQMKELSLGWAGDTAHNCWHLSWHGDLRTIAWGDATRNQVRAHTLEKLSHHRADPFSISVSQRWAYICKYFKYKDLYFLWICCKHNLKQPCKFLLNSRPW